MENILTSFVGTMLAIISAWFIFIHQQKWQIKQKKYQDYIRKLGEIYALATATAIDIQDAIDSNTAYYDKAQYKKLQISANELLFSGFVDNKQLNKESTKIISDYIDSFIARKKIYSNLDDELTSYINLADKTHKTAKLLAETMEDDLNIKNHF